MATRASGLKELVQVFNCACDAWTHHKTIGNLEHAWGKVERFIGYLRRSFFNPLAAQFKGGEIALDNIAANFYVHEWLNKVANIRRHATTQEQPLKLWAKEKSSLQSLPPPYVGLLQQDFDHKICSPAKVTLTDYPTLPLQHPIAIYEQIGQTAFQESYQ